MEKNADALELTGYVRNLVSGKEIEVYAEGSKDSLNILLEHLQAGPPRAVVEKVDVTWGDARGEYKRFGVRY